MWVVDNPESMNQNDGNRLIPTKNNTQVRLAHCTCWEEIEETVNYHAQMAPLIQIPTPFRLLNNPGAHVGKQEFSVADKGYDVQTIEWDTETENIPLTNASLSVITFLAKHVGEFVNLMHQWQTS